MKDFGKKHIYTRRTSMPKDQVVEGSRDLVDEILACRPSAR